MTPSLRVLHVIPSLSATRGGPSAAMQVMAASLVQAGMAVDIATTDDDGAGRLQSLPAPSQANSGVTIHYHPRQTRFYTFSWPLTQWLRQHSSDYDVVHIHALFSYAAIPASLYARRANVPYIVRPLGTLNRWGLLYRRRLLKQASLRLIERRILAGAAAVHFTSEQERIEAQEIGVLGPSVVIPHGIDLDQFAVLPAKTRFFDKHPEVQGRMVILFLSRLDPIKGLDILLPAFQQVREVFPDAMLVLAGDGEQTYVGGLHALVEQLGLSGRIVWTGFLTGDEKREALSAADVFVLPSYSESFGVAAVEAMASGVPVILSDQVGIAADLDRDNAGVVLPPAAEPLAKALIALLSDQERRQQVGENGRRLAHARFTPAATALELISLYERILDRRSPHE